MIGHILAQSVSANPDQIAVSDAATEVTYGELCLLKEGFVECIEKSAHITQGEKVALFLPNCVEFIVAFFALAEMKAIVVPLNIHLREKELDYYVTKCRITTIVTNSTLLSSWQPILSRLKGITCILIDKHLITCQGVRHRVPIRSKPMRGEDESLDGELLYLSTSGSTGRPKIVSRTHSNLISAAANLSKALGVTKHDRFLSIPPFFHGSGLSNCMLCPIMQGASIFLMRHFIPRDALRLMTEENITVLIASPFIFSTLSEVVEGMFSLASLRLCVSTGAPMSYDLSETFLNKFGIQVRQLYGSSETGPVSIQSVGDSREKDSVGKPLETVKIGIRGANGEACTPRHVGQVLVSSPSMTKGYVDEPELNKTLFKDGYVKTGDIGMLDDNGNLYILGREEMFINAAGIKVDPVEIENVLLSYHKIRDAMVRGKKKKRGTEIIEAILVADHGCTISEIIDYCKDRLAEYKIPRTIVFTDKIPKDLSGKVIWYNRNHSQGENKVLSDPSPDESQI